MFEQKKWIFSNFQSKTFFLPKMLASLQVTFQNQDDEGLSDLWKLDYFLISYLYIYFDRIAKLTPENSFENTPQFKGL